MPPSVRGGAPAGLLLSASRRAPKLARSRRGLTGASLTRGRWVVGGRVPEGVPGSPCVGGLLGFRASACSCAAPRAPALLLPGFLPEHPFLSWGHTLHRHLLDYHSCVLDAGCCQGRWCGPVAPGGGASAEVHGRSHLPGSPQFRGAGPHRPWPFSRQSSEAPVWPLWLGFPVGAGCGPWHGFCERWPLGVAAVCREASVLPQERGGALVTVVTAGAGTIPAFNCKRVSGSWGRHHTSRAHRTPQEAFVCSHPVSGPWGGRRSGPHAHGSHILTPSLPALPSAPPTLNLPLHARDGGRAPPPGPGLIWLRGQERTVGPFREGRDRCDPSCFPPWMTGFAWELTLNHSVSFVFSPELKGSRLAAGQWGMTGLLGACPMAAPPGLRAPGCTGGRAPPPLRCPGTVGVARARGWGPGFPADHGGPLRCTVVGSQFPPL